MDWILKIWNDEKKEVAPQITEALLNLENAMVLGPLEWKRNKNIEHSNGVAISNHRILSIDSDKNVTFKYKDYKSNGEYKLLKIPADEFVKRFS